MYEAVGVTVRLGGRTILDRVDLAVAPGRIVVVIGPNGAGKSTLMKAMAGERRPNAGSVRLNGQDVYRLAPRRLAAGRAVLAQSIALGAPFTVDEVVRLGVPPSIREKDADSLVARALAAVELPEAGPRRITHLSGGEQQRAHAARVLAQLWAHGDGGTARYLLLDEPTTHLDPAHQLLLLGLARDHARGGGGVLAILHDLNLASLVADAIAVLHRGRVVACGAPDAIITAEMLAEVYGVRLAVVAVAGRRFVLPHLG